MSDEARSEVAKATEADSEGESTRAAAVVTSGADCTEGSDEGDTGGGGGDTKAGARSGVDWDCDWDCDWDWDWEDDPEYLREDPGVEKINVFRLFAVVALVVAERDAVGDVCKDFRFLGVLSLMASSKGFLGLECGACEIKQR